MTAFVLIILQECKCSYVNSTSARLNAKLFLEMQYESVNDPYTMALTAYALAVTNSQKKQQANEKLLGMSAYDEELNQRYWAKSSESESIEISAYGLLTQLQLENMSTSLSIVNWMNKQRLDGGYFPSSQATLSALQALSQYAIKSKFRDISLTCDVSTSHDEGSVRTIHINNEKALILQQMELDKLDETLYLNVSGKGVGLLSAKIRYNVAEHQKQTCQFETIVHVSEVNKHFSTEKDNAYCNKECEEVINVHEFHSFNSPRPVYPQSKLIFQVEICSRYLSTEDSHLTIIDAGIFSGFSPIKEDLENIVKDHESPVDRYEIKDRKIIFYLDHISHESPICIIFRVKRDYIVGNMQSSVVKVYDFNNDQQCIVFYSPGSYSSLLSNFCEGYQCVCANNINYYINVFTSYTIL
ncbi:cobra venom factor-like [Centruroides vittatus]|uniref:cobra venom factor-like n=1 Tax=Centruroides vittatus TaxID=120091 RepID=UPI00350E9BBF